MTIYLKNFTLFITLVLCFGCAGSDKNNTNLLVNRSSSEQPVQLTTRRQFSKQDTLRMSISEDIAQRAIENYRINKKEQPGTHQYTGADLNADGRAELLVYFTGEGWCAKTGCTLAILAQSKHGYRPISTIRRVKAPIFIAETSTNGWRDLYVHTGHGIASEAPQVKLQFTGNGYPGNAITMTPRPKDVVTIGEVIIEHRSSQF